MIDQSMNSENSRVIVKHTVRLKFQSIEMTNGLSYAYLFIVVAGIENCAIRERQVCIQTNTVYHWYECVSAQCVRMHLSILFFSWFLYRSKIYATGSPDTPHVYVCAAQWIFFFLSFFAIWREIRLLCMQFFCTNTATQDQQIEQKSHKWMNR